MEIKFEVNKAFNVYYSLLLASGSEGGSKKFLEIAEEIRQQTWKDTEYYSNFKSYFKSLDTVKKADLLESLSESDTSIFPASIAKHFEELQVFVEETWADDQKRLESFREALDQGVKKYSKEIELALKDLSVLYGNFNPDISKPVTIELLAINSKPARYGADFGKSLSREFIGLSVFNIESDILVRRIILLVLHEIIHSVFETSRYREFLSQSVEKDFYNQETQLTREAIVNLFAPRGIFAEKYFGITDSEERSESKSERNRLNKIIYESGKIGMPLAQEYIISNQSIDADFVKKIARCVAECETPGELA